MPAMSTPQISVTIQMPEDTELKETARVNDAIAEEIRKVDGVQTVGAMLSSDTMGILGTSAVEDDYTQTAMYIVLDEDKADQGKLIKKKMDAFAKKYNCEIITSADMDMSSMMGQSDINITLYGDDLDQLRTAALDIEEMMGSMKSLEDISDIRENSTKELHVSVDKNEAMSGWQDSGCKYWSLFQGRADEKRTGSLDLACGEKRRDCR